MTEFKFWNLFNFSSHLSSSAKNVLRLFNESVCVSNKVSYPSLPCFIRAAHVPAMTAPDLLPAKVGVT